MMNDISGKVALVLGASRGIGAATALAFARAGAKVVVAARDAKALDELVGAIGAIGGEALSIPTDIADDRGVESLVSRIVETCGRLDIAFNNAGVAHMPKHFAELSIEDIDAALRVNLRGVLVAMKYELRAMLAAGGGSVINMASTSGLHGVRGMTAYSATKHAVVGATKCAALDYAGKNIRVNVVAPGPILTTRIRELTPEQRGHIERAVPMGRIGAAEEVANAVVWLASDASSYVTGTVLSIDGGRTAGA